MNRTPQTAAAQSYSPLYFLASLGAGGLAVTFFMYLMFWVPHKGQPVPVFEDIVAYFSTANTLGQAMIVLAVGGIAALAILHFSLLVWNLKQFAQFRRSDAYATLKSTNAETQLMAVPLTLAMAINASFIVGLVFVPGLWSIVEYLFPFALIGFFAIAIYAFRLMGDFLGRVFTKGGFSHAANNSFAQMLPGFALAMIAVGLSAPAAMSQTPWIVGTSLALSSLLMMAAVIVVLVALVLGVYSMLENGVNAEAAPTIMVVIPILTVLGIAMLRQNHGLHATLGAHTEATANFVMLTRMLAVQVLFALVGLMVLRKQGYGAAFLSREGRRSAGSYALVCPGVALSVLMHFWVNKGLVGAGLIAKFSAAYWIATAPALILQVAMIGLVLHLHRLHFQSGPRGAQIPAE